MNAATPASIQVAELPEAITAAYEDAMYWRGLYEADLAARRRKLARHAFKRWQRAANKHARLRKQLMGEGPR